MGIVGVFGGSVASWDAVVGLSVGAGVILVGSQAAFIAVRSPPSHLEY